MSHVVDVDLEIKDLAALELAARKLDLEFIRGASEFRYYGGLTEPCDHLMRVRGNAEAYEIGVVRRTDGKPGWTLLTDFYAGGRGLVEKIGQNAGKLKQRYQVEVFRREMARKGLRVTERNINGRLMVEAQ